MLKPISLNRVFALKRKLIGIMEDGFLRVTLDSGNLRDFVDEIRRRLPFEVAGDVMFESFKHLGGTVLTPGALRMEAWRIAGNAHLLRNQHPAAIWTHQRFDEWVPVQVIDCKIKRTPRQKKLGAEFSARILAGTPCSLIARFFWTRGFCNNFSRHLGFTPSWKQLPFKRMDELVGLRFHGLARAERSERDRAREPGFEHVAMAGELLRHNRAVLRKRARLDGFKCPKGFTHACYRCPVGYRECEVATHPESFLRDDCAVCNRTGWFDPRMIPLGICVECQRRRDSSFN